MNQVINEKFKKFFNKILAGGKDIEETVTPRIKSYLRWIARLSVASALGPIPFLLIGIVADLRWLTATVGIFWAASTLLLLVVASPFGILMESLDSGLKGSVSRYLKLMSGVISTELYLSLLFSVFHINSNLSYLPLFVICLTILGQAGAWLFNRKFMIVIVSLVFLFLVFSFTLPEQFKKISILIEDSLNRPHLVKITYEDLVENKKVLFTSSGNPIYRYSISEDGHFEVFDGGSNNPFTQVPLKDLDGPAAERLRAYLKAGYDGQKAEEARLRDLKEKERIRSENERKKREAEYLEAQKRLELGSVVCVLAQRVSTEMDNNGLRMLALVPFNRVNSEYHSAFDVYLEERLAGAIRNQGKLGLVDGSKVKEALKGLEKSSAENLEYADLKKVGEISGADSILKGAIHEINGMLAINWSLYRVSEGVILSAGLENAALDPFLSGLMNKVIEVPEQVGRSDSGPAGIPADNEASILSNTLDSVSKPRYDSGSNAAGTNPIAASPGNVSGYPASPSVRRPYGNSPQPGPRPSAGQYSRPFSGRYVWPSPVRSVGTSGRRYVSSARSGAVYRGQSPLRRQGNVSGGSYSRSGTSASRGSSGVSRGAASGSVRRK